MLKATQQAPLWIEEIGPILELLEAKRAAWSIWPRVVNNWWQIAIHPEGLLCCSSWLEDTLLVMAIIIGITSSKEALTANAGKGQGRGSKAFKPPFSCGGFVLEPSSTMSLN